MLDHLIKITWQKLPYKARLRIVRTAQKKFTASVVAVVTNETGEVLVLDHFIRPGASWGLPGGFIEPGEQPREAIARELREETGLELENVELIRIRTIRRHIEILFRAEGRGLARVSSREIRDLGWFSADALPPKMSEPQKELVRELLDGNPRSE